MNSSPRSDPAVLIAMICSGAVSAQFIAGKATRDALYLANLEVTTLPSIVIGTAVVSILLVMASSRGLQKVAPVTFVPVAFALSGVLLFASWLLSFSMPVLAARLVYLQISGLGPMLGSSFWLIASERFDPHTARHHFGRIAGVGTLAGLGGALVAERVAVMVGVAAMLPLLAAVNLFCAWQIRRLAMSAPPSKHATLDAAPPDLAAASPQSGLHVLAQAPYLRNLAGLVLLGTIGAALADYVFKAQAVDTFGRGESLLRFFAIYYAGVSSWYRPHPVHWHSSVSVSASRQARRRSRSPPAVWSDCCSLVWPARWSRGRANRSSAAHCSGPVTKSSTHRSRLKRNAPRNRSSTSASIDLATPSAAGS
jgi:hypothetical protein